MSDLTLRPLRCLMALVVSGGLGIWSAAEPGAQAVDRSKPPSIEAPAGGVTVRQLAGSVAVDGGEWIAVEPVIGATAVRASNGQFTLTLEQSSSEEVGRSRIFFAEGGGIFVP